VLILHHGSIVADGSPDELTRPRGLEVDLASGRRVFEGAGREDAPRIVAELVGAGEQVFAVRVLRSTLEERYLEVVA
jgi:ABC-2 type transport system ATP-binding protein